MSPAQCSVTWYSRQLALPTASALAVDQVNLLGSDLSVLFLLFVFLRSCEYAISPESDTVSKTKNFTFTDLVLILHSWRGEKAASLLLPHALQCL